MSILIGHGRDGRPVFIPDAARATHVHGIGATGTGKSKAMELMIRHDVLAGNGLCLIDPNANLYKATVQWMAMIGADKTRRVHLLNPHIQEWGFGFNPLQGQAEPAVIVDAALSACVQAFGGEDMDAKPRLSRVLRLMLSALLYGGLTIAESVQLLEAHSGRELRQHLSEEARDPVVASGLRDLTALDQREFVAQTESTLNRFSAFIAPPLVRRIVGQSHGIDFRRVMDNGEIVLLNLNPGAGMSEQNARLLGTLFVNSLFSAARLRPEGSPPFYVYIDECYRFLTADVERILDEGRKYGIHLILMHQRLGQLAAAGEHILSAVMTNARTKLVFGGLIPEEAEILEPFLYMGTYDLERVKTRLTTPVTVGHDLVWLANEGHSRGIAESTTHTTATSEGSSESESDSESDGSSLSQALSETLSEGTSSGESYDPDDEDEEVYAASRGQSNSRARAVSRSSAQSTSTGRSRSRSKSASSSHSEAHGVTVSEATSRGRGQSYRAILEERALQTFSLQEQRYERAAEIRNMANREAILKLPTASAMPLHTLTVRSPDVSARSIRAFNRTSLEASPYTRPLAEIDAELRLRQARLSERLEAFIEPPEPVRFRERKRQKAIDG
jgi:hypothetical protein